MNGVRRFLGGGQKPGTPPPPQPGPPPIQTTMPLSFVSNGKPTWPPMSPGIPPSPAIASSVYTPASPGSTPGTPVFFRRDSRPEDIKTLPRVPPPAIPPSVSASATPPRATPTPPPQQQQARPPVPRVPVSPERILNGPSRSNGMSKPPTRQGTPVTLPVLDTRDEMLMSLLASDALVDSRDLQVLSFEEVDELKKEQQVLASRVEALTKKLALETKIRDAALSLQNLNQSHKRMSKPTTEQLDVANRKVDNAQKELYRVSERANEVRRKLLEHRAGVLAFSLRAMEAKGRGAFDTSTEASSPTSESSMPMSFTSHKFDGAHLFAGHADAVMPSSRQPPSIAQMLELEAKLNATAAEAAAAKKKQAELSREISILNMEKDELEATMSLDLQTLQSDLEEARRNGGSGPELEELRARYEAEREEWERERDQIEEDKMDDLARLQEEYDQQRAEDSKIISDYGSAREALQVLIRTHGVITPVTREPSLTSLANAIGAHLESAGSKAADEARRERDEARKEIRVLEERLKDQSDRISDLAAQRAFTASPSNVPISDKDNDRVLQALRGIWPMLPSPEARATKMKAHSPMRSKSPVSPSPRSATEGGPSLSDLDVRQLKALYDPRNAFPSPAVMNEFSVDAFVQRVSALLADDRALIERLIRFAQSHEHLKSNAERAQKLAQESTMGLETYAKQVKALEERSSTLTTRVNQLTTEVTHLSEQLRTATVEKQALELTSTQQAEIIKSLREANDTLSARTLSLASEVSSASETVRAQLEAQLADTTRKLAEAEQELERYSTTQETQRIALLDEMNELQRNNAALRDQLRARK
ncbi:hypothetical protein AURDEDRAFT_112954 [Auricularia subglabra TFB-10046 SS5]|nr:hypothetical protein AURDEDRAFT_112954 [Auricularia subglabra TFB-10046 SS5]